MNNPKEHTDDCIESYALNCTDEVKHILVVDDDKDITDMIVNALASRKCQSVFMYKAEDVIKSLSSFSKYHIAFVDIFMPGVGGIECIKNIKHKNPDCRVVAISGGWSSMSQTDALSAAQKVGADALLPKPFRIEEIRKIAAKMLNS